MPAKKISDKNTKTEIWEAYNNLVGEIEGQPILPLSEQKIAVPDALHSLADLKIKIGTDLDKISSGVVKEIDNFGEIQTRISKDKRLMLDLFDSQKKALEEEIKKTKMAWEEENKEHLKTTQLLAAEESRTRKNNEEEYHYNLSQTRRKELDEYTTLKIEREKILAEKEKILKDRSDEIVAIEKEIAEMPDKISVAVSDARSDLAKELTGKYLAEIKELKMVHEHENKMAELKTNNLESLVKTQTAEIENLKRQIENSTKQVKDIAVSVIEGRAAASKPPVVPQQENTNK